MTLRELLDAEERDGRLAVALFVAAIVVCAMVVCYQLLQSDIGRLRSDNERIRRAIATERARTDALEAEVETP